MTVNQPRSIFGGRRHGIAYGDLKADSPHKLYPVYQSYLPQIVKFIFFLDERYSANPQVHSAHLTSHAGVGQGGGATPSCCPGVNHSDYPKKSNLLCPPYIVCRGFRKDVVRLPEEECSIPVNIHDKRSIGHRFSRPLPVQDSRSSHLTKFLPFCDYLLP